MSFTTRALALVSLFTAVGCTQGSTRAAARSGVVTVDLRPAKDSSTPVATFGQRTLTTKQVVAWFEKIPQPSRARFRALPQREQLVKQRIQLDLLADEALKQGLQKEPEVTAAVKRALVHVLMHQTLEAVPKPTDAEIQAYYEQHESEFDRPARIRLGEILLAAPKNDAKARAQAKKAAARLLPKLRKLSPHDMKGFAQLVHAYSKDPRTVGMNGDLHYLTLEQLTQRYGPAIAQAGAALKHPGDVANPVVDAKGVYLLRLLDRTEASHPTLEQMSRTITNRLAFQAREKARKALIEKVTQAAHLKIDGKALAKIPVDFGTPRMAAPRKSVLPARFQNLSHRTPPPNAALPTSKAKVKRH